MAHQQRNDQLVDILSADFAKLSHNHSGLGGSPLTINDLTDVQITAAAAGDYLRYDGVSQWVDVAISQLLTDLLTVDGTTSGLDADLLDGQHGSYYQAADAELSALAGLTSAADSLPYFTGSGTAALTTLTSFARTLLDDVDAATARTTLGVAVGTNVQAYDAFLTSIALLGTAANKMIYTTGIDTAAEADLTAFARSILDDADEATFKATVNLEIGTDVQAYDAKLAAFSALSPSADRLPYFTGASTMTMTELSSFARTLLNDANYAAAKTTLGLSIVGPPYGLVAQTGATTWADRTITAGNNIGVTNGDGVSGNPTIAATASGSDTQLQFNDGGTSFGADADLTWNKTTNILAISGRETINQSSTSGAAPVLQLTQADVSEEFIRMIGSTWDGSAENLGTASGYTWANGIHEGWLKIYISDAQSAITAGQYWIPFFTMGS